MIRFFMFFRRRRDRLAAEILARPGARVAYRLLTPADRFLGAFRRLPGVLGLAADRLVFETWLEPPVEIPLSCVTKLVSGKVLSTGRRLWRAECLTVTADGALHEFQLTHASAEQWRRALSEWVARQRSASAVVTPGRAPSG
jgi:hypothetical protein